MYIKIALFILFFPTISYGKTISVTTPYNYFKLIMLKNKIMIQNDKLYLSIKQDQCNKKIISLFQNNINLLLKSTPLQLRKVKNEIQLVIDDKVYYERLSSKRGKILVSLPREVQRLKFEDKTLCKR